MIDRLRRVVDLLRGMVGHLVIVSLTLICHICHKAVVVVSMVGDMLCPPIGQQHRVGALNIASTIRVLPRVEVGPRVIVVHPILKTVR